MATATGASSHSRPTLSPLRNRKSPPGPMAIPTPPRSSESPAALSRRSLPRRRSSMVSLGSDLSVESFRSTTDDLFLPRASRLGGGARIHGSGGSGDDSHSSHLHSLPLLLAIVPAIVGIFFQNGTAVMTDLTLLGMAAIFLNWSIRIPWEWYHSAQAVRHQDSINPEDFLPVPDSPDYDDSTILEEEENPLEIPGDSTAGKGDASRVLPDATDGTMETSNQDFPNTKSSPEVDKTSSSPQGPATDAAQASEAQLSAAYSLRRYELLALTACFLAPILGASLLHAIRQQLSRPSEGLVSNYNLTIFLLAAEIRPASHLIKLVHNRTLYLQRVVATSPSGKSSSGSGLGGVSNDALAALAARIGALESQGLSQVDVHAGANKNYEGEGDQGELQAQQQAQALPSKEQLVSDVRRALQPDIDALNRAVRRYEKRATLLSLQIDGRLGALESRVADSVALAAAAERSASGATRKKGSAATLLDWAAGCVVLPIRAASWAVSRILELPARVGRWVLVFGGEVLTLARGSAKEVRRREDGRRTSKTKERERDRDRERDNAKGKLKRLG